MIFFLIRKKYVRKKKKIGNLLFKVGVLVIKSLGGVERVFLGFSRVFFLISVGSVVFSLVFQ